MNISPHVRIITIPAHLLAAVAIGLLIACVIPVAYLGYTILGWFLISGLGIAIGFHRLISHSAFDTWPLVRGVLAYLGVLGGQGSPVFWAALHMGAHHPFSDTAKDLHSPVHGKWSSYLGWQIHLRPEQVPFRAGVHLIREPWLKFLHTHYNKVYWVTMAAALLIDFKIGFTLLILPTVISMHQENLIDLFCHLKPAGYRNFETKDQSVNVWLLGLFAFGQGWHNNHHQYPRRYDFGVNWYEFDICRWIVPLLDRGGPIWGRAQAPAAVQTVHSKDTEAVRA
jgi:fatty-acid desaturase